MRSNARHGAHSLSRQAPYWNGTQSRPGLTKRKSRNQTQVEPSLLPSNAGFSANQRRKPSAGDSQAERGDAVERAPAARLAQDLRPRPRQRKRPERQQDERVRGPAVLLEVQQRRAQGEDEVEVGCRRGEEPGCDAPRDRARRRVLPRR